MLNSNSCHCHINRTVCYLRVTTIPINLLNVSPVSSYKVIMNQRGIVTLVILGSAGSRQCPQSCELHFEKTFLN